MATKVLRTISVHRQEGKDGIKWDTKIGEEASQTFKLGAPLVCDGTSKELEEWAGGTDASLIVGFAAHAASGTAGTKVGYYEANDEFIGEGSLVNGTDAVALAASHINTEYSLVYSATYGWLIDVSDTTTPIVKVIEAIDAVGDYNPRVKFRVLRDIQAKQGNAA